MLWFRFVFFVVDGCPDWFRSSWFSPYLMHQIGCRNMKGTGSLLFTTSWSIFSNLPTLVQRPRNGLRPCSGGGTGQFWYIPTSVVSDRAFQEGFSGVLNSPGRVDVRRPPLARSACWTTSTGWGRHIDITDIINILFLLSSVVLSNCIYCETQPSLVRELWTCVNITNAVRGSWMHQQTS